LDKISETIESMGTLRLDKNIDLIYKKDIELAIKALKKQLPKKVTEKHGDSGFCPVCHMHNLDVFQYCSKCGQKLSW